MSAHFWEGVCFVILIALLYKPIKAVLSNYLEGYTDSIELKVNEAENLQTEAEKTYKYYLTQHAIFKKQIESTERTSKESIQTLRKNANEALEEKIKARSLMHEEKMRLYDKSSLEQVRETITKRALTFVSLYLEESAKSASNLTEIKQMLGSIKDKNITLH